MYSLDNNNLNLYLEKLENQSASLSELILNNICQSSDADAKIRLTQILAGYHNKLSEKTLVYLLNDEDILVRANACDSLYWCDSKETLNKLISVLQTDKYIVRSYAMCSISDIIINSNYLSYIHEVEKTIKYEKSKFVLLEYYSFFYKLGKKYYLSKITEHLNDRKYTDRCHAANVL